MDAKHFEKKRNEFKSYLRKHGLNKNEIEEIFSIDDLVNKLNFQLYDIDERGNGENCLSGFDGICSINEVTTRGEKYKEIIFESDADLYSKTVNGRVVGVESTYDNNLSIFLGDNYISFAETTIKNQYYNGIYTAMREIYHYDITNGEVDLNSQEFEFEGKSFDMPVTFFDSDIEPESYVSQLVTRNREVITLKGNSISALGITFNLETLPEEQRKTPSEVKYITEDGKTTVYLDNVAYGKEVINMEPDTIQSDFEERYYYEDDEDIL